MKRRSLALYAVVALLSTLITGCANFQSGNSKAEETHNSSITTQNEVSETYVVQTDVASTTSCALTTTMTSTASQTELTTTAATTSPQEQTTNPTTTTTSVSTTVSEIMTNPVMPTESTVTPTTEAITTTVPVKTELPITSSTDSSNIQELPSVLMEIVQKYQRIYPNMSIGVGIYSLDGISGYEYNAYQLFNGACTIKASYGLFVCDYCDKNNIDIWSEQLYYTAEHHHGGSGEINKNGYNKWYSVGELLTYLLQVSDNDAMKLLITKFPMNDYYNFIIPIGGEDDWANWNGGKASVWQRRNEWLAIYNYVNSDAPNADALRSFITNTKYAYLMYGMQYIPTYMHKSGWCDSYRYPSAADAAIIGDRYLMIVMTQDYSTGSGHTDAIAELGNAIDDYYYSPGFFWS